MSRRVRPVVLRQRIATRLERERVRVAECSDEEFPVVQGWRDGYLAGLRVARVIVRESGE